MSNKINVIGILKGHINTLKNAGSDRLSLSDSITFFVFPIGIASLSYFFGFSLTSDLTSLLVNFGAIFTALLLSVLVLVYDQGSKLEDKAAQCKQAGEAVPAMIDTKKTLLDQLYYNICYAIVFSVLLVVSCVLESIARGKIIPVKSSMLDFTGCIDFSSWFLMPLVVFVAIHLILTILMIIKRMHILLTTS
ncbi:hypothetical protein [Vibrio gigantis]|uniref:hypothetical protein n=1 Tax=Vibrio gigantis TaxID=296199 RepID=UPI0035A71AF9